MVDVRFGALVIRAEVADTERLREHGLMGRRALAANAGMLFLWPDEAERRFYMKDTLIPLDLIVIRARHVVAVLTLQPCHAEPCPISPTPTADSVLEVNAGTAARAGIIAGARVTSPVLR